MAHHVIQRPQQRQEPENRRETSPALHQGGCLCGATRYETIGEPVRITICHCRFCQRATGAGYMIEPIFARTNVRILSGAPAIHEQPSAGSGRLVQVNFCAACGTKLWLAFERFPDVLGLYAGTFDDPAWFDIRPEISKQIFIRHARPDSILMPHIPCYEDHAITNDGTPATATVHGRPRAAADRFLTSK